MQPCEGVAVNVTFGGDGDVERVAEIATLRYQQRRSHLEKNKQNIRSTREATGVRERFLKTIHPPIQIQIQLREVYFQPGKPLISTVFLGVTDMAAKSFNT